MPHIFLFISIYCLATTKPKTPGQAIISPLINLKFKSVLRNQTEQVPGDLERAAPPPIASLPEFFTLVLFVLFCSPNFFFRPNHEPLPRLRDRHLRFNTSEQLDSIISMGRNDCFFIKHFFYYFHLRNFVCLSTLYAAKMVLKVRPYPDLNS